MIAGAAAALILCSCAGNGKKTDVQAVEELPLVSVTTAVREKVSKDAIYSSTVQANVVNNIAAQTAGRIRKLNVEIGDFVEKGQILAEMDRVSLDQAALKLKNDEIELNRVKALLSEGGISQSDYDALELAFNVSKSSYENLLENTILRAPVSGVITARNYDTGDMYAMSSPIYTVQQITPVKLLVAVSESEYTKVKKNDKVVLKVDAIPGKTFDGAVARIYPTIDPASHTFTIEVQVKNAGRELRPGMYARVEVNKGVDDSIVIPDTAVLKQQGSGVRTVFVLLPDNTVDLRVVTLGLNFDGKYEVLSGIEEGDTVLTGGQYNLKSGDKVEVEK